MGHLLRLALIMCPITLRSDEYMHPVLVIFGAEFQSALLITGQQVTVAVGASA